MKSHIRLVANANGINKNIAWHTFRHSFGTLLKANGADVKTVQVLLRHTNTKITLVGKSHRRGEISDRNTRSAHVVDIVRYQAKIFLPTAIHSR
jgi:integrase